MIPYRKPTNWIAYDAREITAALVEAKSTVLSLSTVPYQRAWVEKLQMIELKREVAGTSKIEGAEFTDRELDVALNETPQQLLTRACRVIRGRLEGRSADRGPRAAGRVSVRVSEFVGGTRGPDCGSRAAGRRGSTEPPTRDALRWSLPLPRPLTLADLRWPRRPLAHVGQPRKHGAQAVKQRQQGQDLGLGSEVEYQHALQGRRCLARLPAGAAEAAQPVGALAAGGFCNAKVGAQKRTAELVLWRGIAARKPARECIAKA